MNNTSRKSIRTETLDKRRRLSTEEVAAASQKVCEQLIHTSLWQKSQHIAFYVAHHNEIDPAYLMKIAHAQQKICYLPALAQNDLKHLVMTPYKPNDKLIENVYGIPEPAQDSSTLFSVKRLDLVLVPLVAFDSQGTRLGMGVGYYDRTFDFLNQNPRPEQPVLMGLAYHFQQVEHLHRESWDVGLDWVVTEKEVVNTQEHGIL